MLSLYFQREVLSQLSKAFHVVCRVERSEMPGSKGAGYKCHVPGCSLCWARRQGVISNDSYGFQPGTSPDPCAQMMSNFPFRAGCFVSWCRRSCPESVPET